MEKIYYSTLDNETFGGAASPKGSYHLGGIIHDGKGKIVCGFNYLIAENYEQINKDEYAKENFERYEEMRANGSATMIDTEEHAVEMVEQLFKFYNVKYVMAYNSAFDLIKTKCAKLIEKREFIDLWLMALETIVQYKSYAKFCHDNNFQSRNKRSCATTAEAVYAFLTNNPKYNEEHTAFEDSKIELFIFMACRRTHKKYTRNIHCMDAKPFALFPRW